jgi:hypothetical protein
LFKHGLVGCVKDGIPWGYNCMRNYPILYCLKRVQGAGLYKIIIHQCEEITISGNRKVNILGVQESVEVDVVTWV